MKIFQLISIIIFFSSCATRHSEGSKLDSDDYATREDRIEKLNKVIKSYSALKDAEFELFNVNGFDGSRTDVPGASSWDYKVAMKVDTADITRWTEGFEEMPPNNYDQSWTKEITKQRSQNWITQSNPQYFYRTQGNVSILVFQQEGIIFKRMLNL